MYFGVVYDSQNKQWLFCKRAQSFWKNSESFYEISAQFTNICYRKSMSKNVKKEAYSLDQDKHVKDSVMSRNRPDFSTLLFSLGQF